jgi:hypothetical protein
MLARKFKFKRNSDKGGFQWTAEFAMNAKASTRASQRRSRK